MGTLAFFPWLRLKPKKVSVENFELIPYLRAGYAGSDAEVINAVTAPYREVNDDPIQEATLLRIHGQDLTADLDEAQIDLAFAFAEMVTLAGLAKRQFFDQCAPYTKRDNYRLVIQRFDEPGKGTFQRTPRRDGTRGVYVMAAVHRVRCPGHIDLERVDLDLPLLEALVACRNTANADALIESTMTFNLANTESSAVSQHVELVLSSGALQRVLACQGSDHHELAKKFVASLSPRKDVLRRDCHRLLARADKFPKSTTIRDAWVRDLYALRGDLAHGKIDPKYSSTWTLREHLLLASYIFPFVMKTQLAKCSLYTMTEEDQLAIDAFESLACAPDLLRPLDAAYGRSPWSTIIRQVADEVRRARAIAELERLDRDENNDPG